MSKFVKEGCDLVESQQGGFGWSGLGKITYNGNMRPLILRGSLLLTPEAGHPGAVSFAGAGKEVGIKHRNVFTQSIGNFIDSHIQMIDLDFSMGLTLYTIKHSCCLIHTLDRILQVQIRY